jgi:hypothetical protein
VTSPRRRRGLPVVYITAPAGSWRAAGDRLVKLRRIPSPPVQAYNQLVTVPIGNDGISFPVAIGAGGTARTQVGPSGVGSSWSPSQANAYSSLGQLADPSTVSLYVGPAPIQQYQVAANLLGGGSQFALGGVTLTPGWYVWAVWAGGTPGTIVYLIVSGDKTALSN